MTTPFTTPAYEMFVWSPMTTSTRPAVSPFAKLTSAPAGTPPMTESTPLWVITITALAPALRAIPAYLLAAATPLVTSIEPKAPGRRGSVPPR